jgi:hypothetical protein
VPSPQPPPDVPPAIRAHVEEALAFLLRPEELDGWKIRWIRDEGAWDLVVDVVACGERYLGFIAQADAGYPLEEGLDTFTNGLEDFISESRFAWGRRREMNDRPWRR